MPCVCDFRAIQQSGRNSMSGTSPGNVRRASRALTDRKIKGTHSMSDFFSAFPTAVRAFIFSPEESDSAV